MAGIFKKSKRLEDVLEKQMELNCKIGDKLKIAERSLSEYQRFLDFIDEKVEKNGWQLYGIKKHKDDQYIAYFLESKLEEEPQYRYNYNIYAYSKEELFSNKNTVFELHYSTIFDLKRICPSLCTIYLMPKDINKAKEKTIHRTLPKDVEKKRLAEIDEHYNNVTCDEKLRNMFDYIIYNNYDKQSEDKILKLVSNLISKN